MIPSASPSVQPVAIIIFMRLLFSFGYFEKWGRTYRRTDGNRRENNDHYRPGLWVGRVDQWEAYEQKETIYSLSFPSWGQL